MDGAGGNLVAGQAVARATGVGSLPGRDVAEAVNETFGELDFPYLPELPGRGPGAEMIGRSAALLVELPVEVYSGRWRVASRSGADLRRAHDLRERDLDALTERADRYTGPLKLQSAGPWTLAAAIELAIGGAILKDHGAVRDLAASLSEGLRIHVEDVRKRVPGAQIVVQLDEPSLPMVLSGQIPTESGLHTYRSVEASRARETLSSIVDNLGVPAIVHCCAPEAPLTLLREAGVAGVSLDLAHLNDLDALGEIIDAGLSFYAGAVPTSGKIPAAKDVAEKVRRLWQDLGFPLAKLPGQTIVTPACGLAGATPAFARSALKTAREAAKYLSEV